LEQDGGQNSVEKKITDRDSITEGKLLSAWILAGQLNIDYQTAGHQGQKISG
jgi:hypothetical protein